jgi:two-component system chemotaxis sensor kinase CheA
VEDSITARSLLRNIIESAGFDVTTAVDGVEAMDVLKKEQFTLVVSDIEMPRMNGIELTTRIRSDQELADLPVILVTALESADDRQRGMEAGANAYINKSNFEQNNLIETIQRLI